MNSTVWKFPLMLAVEQTINVPAGADWLTVQMQDDRPVVWAHVNPAAAQLPRRILMVGTGHALLGKGVYLGTAQMVYGGYVWHFFEAAS